MVQIDMLYYIYSHILRLVRLFLYDIRLTASVESVNKNLQDKGTILY